MTLPRNIFLVGMPGAGKSTLGKSLAKRLSLHFVDADQELVGKTGVPIATIFEFEGEAGFRERETQLLAELVARDEIVLATGGGAILAAANRMALRKHGVVIYLRAGLEDLRARTLRDTKRPLLQAAHPEKVLRELLETREPLYNEVADLIVDTGRLPAAKLTETIIERLSRQGLWPPAARQSHSPGI
jgi:shikimate kinase